MSMRESIGTAFSGDETGVMNALIVGLEIEFGTGANEALARRFLEAEEADFYWDARDRERWLGAYESIDDDDRELDRVAICGCLEGRWFMTVMLVDGGGMPHAMTGRRDVRSRIAAWKALADAH